MYARFLLVIAACIGSLLGIFINKLEPYGWTALQAAWVRSLIASPFLFLLLRGKVKVPVNARWNVFWSAVAFTLCVPAFLVASVRILPGLATSLLYLSIIWLVLYEWWILRHEEEEKKLSRFTWLAGLFGVFAAGVMAWSSFGGGLDLIGLACGAFCSFGFAFLVIQVRIAKGKGLQGPVVGLYGTGMSAIVLAPPALLLEPFGTLSPETAPWVLSLGFISGVAYVSVSFKAVAIARNAPDTAILQQTEIIWANLFVLLFLGVVPGSTEYIVGALILVSGVFSMLDSKSKKQEDTS